MTNTFFKNDIDIEWRQQSGCHEISHFSEFFQAYKSSTSTKSQLAPYSTSYVGRQLRASFLSVIRYTPQDMFPHSTMALILLTRIKLSHNLTGSIVQKELQ